MVAVTLPGVWADDEFTAREGDHPATIVIETDGLATGTTITMNGKPVDNCSSIELKIDTESMLARATLTLNAVPVKFTGTLTPEKAE